MWSRVRDLVELREKEAGLFGSSGERGQSRVMMSMTQPTVKPALDAAQWRPNSWENYTGYGLRDAKRKALAREAEFTVLLTAKSAGVFTADFLDALRLLGLAGVLGARSRNGWGSITLSTLEGAATWSVPRTSADVRRELERIVTTARNVSTPPPFTALSAQSEIGIGNEFQKADAAQRALGEFYKRRVQELPKDKTRWQFGIPRQSKRPALRNSERRAKPLFLHVHQAEGAKAIPVALFLPAQFTERERALPNNGDDARALVRTIRDLRSDR